MNQPPYLYLRLIRFTQILCHYSNVVFSLLFVFLVLIKVISITTNVNHDNKTLITYNTPNFLYLLIHYAININGHWNS